MNIVYLKYGLIGMFLLLGGLLHARLGIGQAWYLYAGAVLLLGTHLFLGNVWTAYTYLKRGQVEKAESILSKVWSPGLLLKRNKAYYHLSRGLIFLQRKNFEAAEPLLLQALDIGLKHPNDNALAALNLAHLYYVQGEKDKARHWADQVRSFAVSDLLIKDKLKELDRALAS